MSPVSCTGRDFEGLVNPYTGEPLAVGMIATPSGRCLFAAPDAYSTAWSFGSPGEAYDAWAREAGIAGVRRGQPIRCAYTGEALAPEETPDGRFRYRGGFDPNVFRPRAEFLYYATMRDGRAARPVPEPEAPVGAPSAPSPRVATHETQLTDDAMRRAEASMKAARFEPPRKTKVSMSVGRKGAR